MRSLQVSPHCSNSVVQKNLSNSRDTCSHSRWQIIYLIQVANLHSAELIAPLVNLSVHSIYKIVEGYNQKGAPALIDKRKGGRRRSILSVEEEAALFVSLENLASKGLIKTADDIRSVVEKKVGKLVSDYYLGICYIEMIGKRKCPGPIIPNEVWKNKLTLKKTPQKAGIRPNELFR